MTAMARMKLNDVLCFLRESLANRRFVPGQRLVEADLTQELGISRSMLREAFRQIAAEGLIELIPNRGAMVRRLSRCEAIELFQIRAELESLAVRLAAERCADPAVRAPFETAVARIWSDAPRVSAAAYIEENSAFHDAIYAASGNGQLARLNGQLQLTVIMAQIGGMLDHETIRDSVAEHRGIARAILDGDADRAASLIRAHLARASRVTLDVSPSDFRVEDKPEAD